MIRHPDLRTCIKENRGAIIWAALVLVQNWMSKGRSKPSEKVQRLGGFENWSEVVGGILETAGYAGFLSNLSCQEVSSGKHPRIPRWSWSPLPTTCSRAEFQTARAGFQLPLREGSVAAISRSTNQSAERTANACRNKLLPEDLRLEVTNWTAGLKTIQTFPRALRTLAGVMGKSSTHLPIALYTAPAVMPDMAAPTSSPMPQAP